MDLTILKKYGYIVLKYFSYFFSHYLQFVHSLHVAKLEMTHLPDMDLFRTHLFIKYNGLKSICMHCIHTKPLFLGNFFF